MFKNKIEENNFECIEQTKKRDLFSIDYLGNFSYSSTFEFFEQKKKKKKNLKLFILYLESVKEQLNNFYENNYKF